MAPPSQPQIEAAAARLRGHTVATPLIGGIRLVGFASPEGLRVKVEQLQPAGTMYYRGALHHLLRWLGSLKGVAVYGAVRPVLAAAVAAAQLRIETVVFPVGEPDAATWKLLQQTGCEVRPRPTLDEARAAASQVRAAQGFHLMPGVDDPDYAAGLATVGWELASELSRATELVVISPCELAESLAAGLLAAGNALRVQGVDGDVRAHDELAVAVRMALRVDSDDAGLAALAWTLEHAAAAEPCVVLSC